MLSQLLGPAGLTRLVRPLRLVSLALVVGLLAGCAASLPLVERPASMARTAPPDAALARLARDAGIAADQSGVYPLPQATFALDARLALVAYARDSFDLQYYVIADEGIGHLILRGLRDAARRGVRVRRLLDDLHTTGMDRLLLGLAAEPNVELRLFNPFATGRESTLARALGLLLDFGRLEPPHAQQALHCRRRGGHRRRPQPGERVFSARHRRQFHRLRHARRGRRAAGTERRLRRVLEQRQAYPVQAIATPGIGSPDSVTDAAFRAAFEVSTRPENTPAPAPAAVTYGVPPLSTALAAGRVKLIAAAGRAFVDSPAKADPMDHSEASSTPSAGAS